MFTGIIEELGVVRRMDWLRGRLRLKVEAERVLDDLTLGDSLSINGVCLTVVDLDSGSFGVDAVEETVRRTTLGHLHVGERVNLERALRLYDRLGGHIVTGHIDGVGTVRSRRRQGASILLSIEVPEELLGYLIVKGSVAVDGVSLTVVDVVGSKFSVSIVPFTADNTTFGFRRVGDRMNVEVDLIGKYVAKLMGSNVKGKTGITKEWLQEMGF